MLEQSNKMINMKFPRIVFVVYQMPNKCSFLLDFTYWKIFLNSRIYDSEWKYHHQKVMKYLLWDTMQVSWTTVEEAGLQKSCSRVETEMHLLGWVSTRNGWINKGEVSGLVKDQVRGLATLARQGDALEPQNHLSWREAMQARELCYPNKAHFSSEEGCSG